ncbi:MAG: acyl-CoA dehydrogenase family protein [Caulobacter sp.]|nr:acyl-CoA dehydrogenase family protein [Caulobacter sp.]
MITFALSEEQTMIRESLQGFAAEVLAPRARAIDEAGEMPAEVIQAGWDFGLIAASIPEAYGGGGGDRSCMTNAVVLEALGGGCASQAVAIMAPGQFVSALIDFGTEEQKAEHLPRFAGPTPVAAGLALQESQFGFAAEAQRTTATRKGNGWVLNGEKRLIPLGDQADHFLVLARDPDGDGLGAVSAFIVPRDAAGLTVTAESGSQGLKPVPKARITLNAVELPGSARLGGDAGIDAGRLVNQARIGAAAVAVGLCRQATDYALPYAKERVAFGEPIGKKQSIAFMLADMHIECETMRWMVWKAASLLEHNDPGAARASVLAQDYVRRKAIKIADDALQIFGGHGFIRDLPLEMWLRNARTLTVLDGPVSV